MTRNASRSRAALTTMLRSLWSALTLVLAAYAAPAAAAYPERAISIVVPFPAGGSTDLVARELATELGAILRQPVVVENKAGAGSLVGSALVAKAAPDGYTLLMSSLTNLFLPHVHAGKAVVGFDDFVPVGLVAELPNVLAVGAATPYTTLAALVAADKASPGKLSFASAGAGTPSHLVCEMVNHRSGSKLQHVPYKGNAPAVNDLLAGHIPVMCNNLGGTLPYMAGGRIRMLAQTGRSRSAAAPEVPTFAELGIDGLDTGLWFGLVAPKGIPREALTTLNQALVKALALPALREKLAKLGATPMDAALPAFAARLEADRRAWDPVLKTVNLKAD
jgi:tripartite-type tricarboxylate transporter receptor subunit TctC